MSKPLRKNDIVSLSEVEHCLKRPGVYIGSTQEEVTSSYVYEDEKIVLKDVPQIPGLLKLFDEAISNSVDEAIRTNFKYANKIKIQYDHVFGTVSVEDNGRGLPIEQDENGKWTPEIIFGQLRAGSNFDDENKGMVVGQNGMGISLVNIFSKKFSVESANGHKLYTQTWENHMAITGKPKIKDSKDNYTIITYQANYDYFKVSDEVKQNIQSLFYKRVKDLAFCYPEITFYWGKEKITASNLKGFLKQIHEVYESNEVENGRIGLFYSDTEFQQMSYVNGAYTYHGGTHVDYAINIIVNHLREFLKKKHKIDVKPIDIKTKLFLILSIRMQAPQFDTQSKTKLISANHFKATIDSMLTKKFLDSICRNEEIILPIVETYKLKMQVKDNIELKKLNQNKKKVRIDNFYPAVKENKYIMLTEGQSALGLLMPVISREYTSFFPLKGKPLNTLEAPVSKLTGNEEIKNIINILNLKLDKDDQSDLTHNKIVFATDSDLDAHHIKGLLLCLFQRFAPSLIKSRRVAFLETPLIVAKKKDIVKHCFYSFDEYNKFKNSTTEKYEYDYKKGLGSWKKEELQEIFKKGGVEKFIVDFEPEENYETIINNWMSGKTVDYRKEKVSSKQFDISGV